MEKRVWLSILGLLVLGVVAHTFYVFYSSQGEFVQPSVQFSPDSSLLAYYPFDSISSVLGGESTPDSSLYDRDAFTINNTQIVNSIFGPVIQFTQANLRQYATISGGDLTEINGPFAVSVWAKLDRDTTETGQVVQTIIADGRPGFYPSLMLFVNQNNQVAVKFHYANSDPEKVVAVSSLIIEKNKWYHFAAELENDQLKLYINGTLAGQAAANGHVPYDPNSDFSIGTYEAGRDWFWNGAMNELQVYNRSLSDSELISLSNRSAYLAGPPVPLETEPPLVTLNSPSHNSAVRTALVSFNASFSDNVQLANATLFVWNASRDLINTTIRFRTGTTNNTAVPFLLPYKGSFSWNYRASDNSSNRAFGSANFTISYDPDAPLLSIVFPENRTYNDSVNRLAFTSDSGSSACWYTQDNGAHNVSASCGAQNISVVGVYQNAATWILYANDSAGNTNRSSVTFSVSDVTPPAVTIDEPRNRTYVSSSVTFRVILQEEGNAFFSLDDGATNYSMSSSNNLTFTRLITDLENTGYLFTLYAQDRVGNTNVRTVSFSIRRGSTAVNQSNGSSSSGSNSGSGSHSNTGSGSSSGSGEGGEEVPSEIVEPPAELGGNTSQSSTGKVVVMILAVFFGIIILGVIVVLVTYLRNRKKTSSSSPSSLPRSPRPPFPPAFSRSPPPRR